MKMFITLGLTYENANLNMNINVIAELRSFMCSLVVPGMLSFDVHTEDASFILACITFGFTRKKIK